MNNKILNKNVLLIFIFSLLLISMSVNVKATIDNVITFDNEGDYSDCHNHPDVEEVLVRNESGISLMSCNVTDGKLYMESLNTGSGDREELALEKYDNVTWVAGNVSATTSDHLITTEVLLTDKYEDTSSREQEFWLGLEGEFDWDLAVNTKYIMQHFYNSSDGCVYNYINGTKVATDCSPATTYYEERFAVNTLQGFYEHNGYIYYVVTEHGPDVSENIGEPRNVTIEPKVNYAYSEKQVGNTNYLEGNEVLNFTSDDNITYCQPFVAPLDGNIKEFYFSGDKNKSVNAGTFKYIFDDEKNRWHTSDTAFCSLNCGTKTEEWIQPGEPVDFAVEAGNTYWLCMGANAENNLQSTIDSELYVSDAFAVTNEMEPYQGVTTHYNGLVGDLIQDRYLMEKNYEVSGSFIGWTQVPHTLKNFQYCYEEDGGKCFQFSNFNFNPEGLSTGGEEVVGEAFKYQKEDGQIVNINMMLSRGSNLTSSDKFKIGLYDANLADNSIEPIYESEEINVTEIENNRSVGYSIFNHSVGELLYLYKGEEYVVGVKCVQGCSDNFSEKIYVANTDNEYFDDWFVKGYKGRFAYTFDENLGDNANENSDAWFLFDMKEDVWSAGDAEEDFIDTGNCTTWEFPYYLKENFEGCIYECGWYMTSNKCFDGFYKNIATAGYNSMNKETDLASVDETNYVSMNAEIKPVEFNEDGMLKFTLYDSENVRLSQVIIKNGTINTDVKGVINEVDNLTIGEWTDISIHVDLQADNYDLYVNESLVASGVSFKNPNYNTDNINFIAISNSDAEVRVDNLALVATNSDNEIYYPSQSPVQKADKDYAVCGRLLLKKITCSSDGQCPTGVCHEGACSRWDWTYCDKEGMVRGYKCMFVGTATCILGSVKNFIFDNFIYFAVFIIMLMGAGYLILIFGKSKR